MAHRPLKKSSRIPLRSCLNADARLAALRECGHDADPPGPLSGYDAAEKFIENAVGAFPVPLGVATNFIVNGKERLVAMATEERSVVAAASYAAKLCRDTGGFTVEVGPNVSRGQILFVSASFADGVDDEIRILAGRTAAELDREEGPMRKHGGGLVNDGFGPGVLARWLDGGDGRPHMLVIDFEMHVADAMGANVVTRFGEKLASRLESLLGVRRTAVICSNDLAYLHGAPVRARATWPISADGERVADDVIRLQRWAEIDDFRAVTHNKGIMNGVSAVALATGQDVRAIEAAAHAAATHMTSAPHRYAPLTRYRRTREGIEGTLELRVPLGTVGGATSHPTAAWYRKLMGVENVRDLAAIVGAVGLAQNFAALRSLADEGITEAHVRLRK